MVTFKAVVLPHQQKEDGSYNVKIRVTHQRKSKYLPTTLVARKTDLTKSLKIKEYSSLRFKCNEEIKRLTDCISNIGYYNLSVMDVAQVVEYIKAYNAPFELDFFQFADSYISKLSEGNRKTYIREVNVLERFLGERRCPINSITKTTVRDLLDFISNEPKTLRNRYGFSVSSTPKKALSSQQTCIMRLKTIFNAAREKYNDEDLGVILIPRRPFDGIKFSPVIRKGPASLTLEEMQSLISYNGELTKVQRMYLDLFILSFAFRGMNIADMYELKKPSESFVYYRKKTRQRRLDKAETRVLVPSYLNKYIERVSDGGYLIRRDFAKGNPYNFSTYCAKNMKNITKKIIGKECTMYAARDTFATSARNVCKFDAALVDESLVHTSKYKLIDAYVEKDWSVLHEVQTKVLSLFSWE